MILGVKMAEICEKTRKTSFKKKTRKGPLEFVKMKNSKIGLRHVLSWPKVGLDPKFHDPGIFGGFGKRGQTDRHTHRQDSFFISIDC